MSESIGPFLGQVFGFAQGMAGGGLPMLLAQFENAGLAERFRSWIDHGANLPVTPEEITTVFTPAQLDEGAAKAGMTREAFARHLSEKLPEEVNRATPPV